jgi:hypothetical protein
MDKANMEDKANTAQIEAMKDSMEFRAKTENVGNSDKADMENVGTMVNDSDMEDVSGMDDSTDKEDKTDSEDSSSLETDSDIEEIPAVDKTRKGYTCRLPTEIMDVILSHLARTGQNKSLCKLQSTSSAMYMMTTPYLYHDLDFGRKWGDGLAPFRRLISLFDHIVSDRQLFLQDHPVSNQHPIDLDLYHRLRWALSFVKTLKILLPAELYDLSKYDIEMYTDIVATLRVLQLGSIWPALESVTIKIDGLDGEDPWEDIWNYLKFPFNNILLSLVAEMSSHLLNLEIDLPPPIWDEHGRESEEIWINHAKDSELERMNADHVVIRNLSDAWQGVPMAHKSLMIDFALHAGCMETRNRHRSERMTLCYKARILSSVGDDQPSSLRSLTIIGIERELDGIPEQGYYDNPHEHHEALSPAYIHAELIRAIRHFKGSTHEDFRYRIKPFKSGETGKWDVWHKMGEKFGDQ